MHYLQHSLLYYIIVLVVEIIMVLKDKIMTILQSA